MHKSLLWPHEVGAAIGLSAKTINRMADSGAVEVIRDAKGRRRFKPEAIAILRRTLGLEEVIEGAGTNHDHTANTI